MTKITTKPGAWKPGHSGNPKGRPRKAQALTDMLRVKGESVVYAGGQPIAAQEALARAVWQFVLTGEVQLMGKHLEAASATEWASVVKWLYAHVEPTAGLDSESEPEMIVRVLREDREEHLPPLASGDEGLPFGSPSRLGGEGEQDESERMMVGEIIPQVMLSGGNDIASLALESTEEDWL